jgi:hypothetical protein
MLKVIKLKEGYKMDLDVGLNRPEREATVNGQRRLFYMNRKAKVNNEIKDIESPLLDKYYVDSEIAKLRKELELLKKVTN